MKIGYFGPKWTFTEQAASILLAKCNLPESPSPIRPLRLLLEKLKEGNLDLAVAPFYNSKAGPYTQTVKAIKDLDLTPLASTGFAIRLAIGIHPDSSEDQISEVQSYSTALDECPIYLNSKFPDARQVVAESTADAMENIMSARLLNVAAIGREEGLRALGLKVLATDIQDPGLNQTTFLLLKA